MFHLAVLNSLRMSMLINAQNPLRSPVPLLALATMSTTAWMASTVDLPFRKPSWFSERPFSPTMWPCSHCRNISSRSFPIVCNRQIGLWDEASSRGLLPFLSRTNLCFFQSTKNLPSRRQELKASRRISGYAPITSLRISFGTPSIRGAVFAFKPPTRSLQFLESEEFFAPDNAGTSVLSLERLYVFWRRDPMGPFRLPRSRLSSTEVGFSLCHA